MAKSSTVLGDAVRGQAGDLGQGNWGLGRRGGQRHRVGPQTREQLSGSSLSIYIIPVIGHYMQAIATLAQMPGAVPYRVQMPQYGGAYRVSLDYPRDKVAGERNLVVIDQYSGDVIALTRSGELSSAERILAANEAIHTGAVLGMPGRIVAWMASIIVPVQVMSGVLLWLRRRGAQQADRLGKGAS
jgi:uncharacterized iron-regulated membrane protein